MAKPKSNYSTIKVKDNKYITIYFRNTHFRSGYQISDETDFNKTTKKFSTKWKKQNPNGLEAIENLKQKIDTLIAKARGEKQDELQYIKSQLEEEKSRTLKIRIANEQKPSVVFEKYVEKVINRKINKANTKQRHTTHLNKIKWYEQTDKRSIAEVDKDYIYDFIKWMAEEKIYIQNVKKRVNSNKPFEASKKVRNTNATIKRWLTDFNTFLYWVEKNNKFLKFPHEEILEYSRSLDTPDDAQEIIALTQTQWLVLRDYVLPNHQKGIQSSLDAFRFCCWTGLRSSDLRKLNQAYILEDGKTICMPATKTGHKFWVKMNPNALKIFKKYNNDFRDKFPTVQRLSINLRKILREIPEFQHNDIKRIYCLEEIEELPVKNYEKFTFHSSRRTFVTNCLRTRPDIELVRKMTGWSDMRQLEAYLDYANASIDKMDEILNF